MNNTDIDIKTAHEHFCDRLQGILCKSASSVRCHKETIISYLKYTQIQKPRDMNQEDIEGFITSQQKRGLVGNTRRIRLQSMILFIDWLIENNYMRKPNAQKRKYSKQEIQDRNFAREVPRPICEHKVIEKLTPEQIQKILYWARTCPCYIQFEQVRNYTIIAVFCLTGMRRGELLGLDLSDINIENRTILVRKVKNGKDPKQILISDQLLPILKNYITERNSIHPTFRGLFISSRANKKDRMSLSTLERLMVKLKKKTGLHFRSHKLRHSFASMVLQGGVDMKTTSELLGHGNMATTSKYYIHLDNDHKRKALEKMPQLT